VGGSALARLRGISKTYGGVRVVSNVDLTVSSGKVLVIAGENGAGKTTALRVLAGLVRPDAGEVEIAGARAVEASPRAARAAGVALVAQHFSLVEGLSALENVVLPAPPKGPWGGFRAELAREKVEAIVSRLGVRVDLSRDVAALGVGERQRLELARALYFDAKVLLLDEPTAILSPREADDLYGILHGLAVEGRAVAVVSHKLDEIRRHADAVTVLRRGEVTLDEPLSRGDVDAATMARIEHAILGEAVARTVPPPPRSPGLGVARLARVSVGRLRELDLVVHEREIVGVAGVTGNGQEELVHLFAGALRAETGEVSLPEKVAVVHEDRHREGLCLDVPLRDNVLLGEHARYSRFGLLDTEAMDVEARRRLEAAGVRGSGDTLDLDLPARALSGGNQQKIVCARAFAHVSAGAKLLVLAHPTRGVDPGAAHTIRDGVRAAAETCGVVLVSADLGELRALASRILVLFRGRAQELPVTASDEEIGRAMLGEGSS
jgi:ABC-type uncharacterized transport system ATPase subunit